MLLETYSIVKLKSENCRPFLDRQRLLAAELAGGLVRRWLCSGEVTRG